MARHWPQPIGALSVLGLLALVGVQAATGLFANDDIAYQGPLADIVGKELSDNFHGWHAWLQNGLLALVVLHVGAITFYLRVKKEENLVKPMITGWSGSPHRTHAYSQPQRTHRGGGVPAFIVAVLIAAGATYAAAGGLLPAPPPAPASRPLPHRAGKLTPPIGQPFLQEPHPMNKRLIGALLAIAFGTASHAADTPRASPRPPSTRRPPTSAPCS